MSFHVIIHIILRSNRFLFLNRFRFYPCLRVYSWFKKITHIFYVFLFFFLSLCFLTINIQFLINFCHGIFRHSIRRPLGTLPLDIVLSSIAFVKFYSDELLLISSYFKFTTLGVNIVMGFCALLMIDDLRLVISYLSAFLSYIFLSKDFY